MIHNDSLERTPLSVALLSCSILAASFVGSLYYFIPPSIRRFDRDHHLQIKWRTAATTVVCIVSTATLPFVIPSHTMPSLTVQQSLHAILGVISHTVLLYGGPITQMMVQVTFVTRQIQEERKQRDSFLSLFCKTWYSSFLAPVLHSLLFSTTTPSSSSSNERWACLRNRILAPITEEVVFRRCIVSILHSTGMSTFRIVVLAPLFFGIAHVHHAILLHRRQAPARTILLQTLFQFGYTSVFGSYATYAYLRTGSILAVILSHAVCNGMGLPDLAFATNYSNNRLYPFRYLLGCAHVAGLLCFYGGFHLTWLLPDHRSQ